MRAADVRGTARGMLRESEPTGFVRSARIGGFDVGITEHEDSRSRPTVSTTRCVTTRARAALRNAHARGGSVFEYAGPLHIFPRCVHLIEGHAKGGETR